MEISIDPSAFIGPESRRIGQAGGVAIEGDAQAAVIRGQHLMAVKLLIEPGFHHPWHNHPANESMGVVVEGLLEMRIGDAVRRFGPGDVWHHPVAVHHWTRALERTLAVEFHAPLREDLASLPEYRETV